jgi:hypothetical protein
MSTPLARGRRPLRCSESEHRAALPIQLRVVAERLERATISIELDTYSRAIPAMQEEAATLIAGLVFAGE